MSWDVSLCFFRASRRALEGSPNWGGGGGFSGALFCVVGFPGGPLGASGKSMVISKNMSCLVRGVRSGVW